MYDPVDPPKYRVGQPVIAASLVALYAGGPYETVVRSVRAVRATTRSEPQWLYKVDEHPLRRGGHVGLFGCQLRPASAVVQLAALVDQLG